MIINAPDDVLNKHTGTPRIVDVFNFTNRFTMLFYTISSTSIKKGKIIRDL